LEVEIGVPLGVVKKTAFTTLKTFRELKGMTVNS